MADNAAENIKAFSLEGFQADYGFRYDDEDENVEAEEEDDNVDETAENLDEEALDHSEIEDVEEEDAVLIEEEISAESDWKNASFQRLGCLAHALQLVIKEALNSSQIAKELIKIVSEMVSFFHKSNTWTDKLYRRTKLHVVPIGKTRWNTVSIALERMLKVSIFDAKNYFIVLDLLFPAIYLIFFKTGKLY